MKLPPIPEQQALRAAVPAPGRPSAESGQRHAALLQLAQSGVPEWVRAMVDDTAAELASSNQRNAVAGDRQYTATALAQLQGHREALIAQLVLAMQHQLKPGVAAARDAAAAARAAQPLQLIEESQIDEDIEIARIVQAIESESDWELRQLRALSSGLLGLPAIDENAAPLGPLACATGLRLALSGLGVDGGTRLLLMRVLGPALGRAVKDQYAELSRRLLGWGIDPAPYKVRQTPAATPGRREGAAAPAAPTLPSDESATDRTSSALRQLVESARLKLAPEDPTGAAAADAGAADAPLSLRLFNDPLPAESARAALDPTTAVVLMERLFAQIERHLGGSDATRRLLGNLQAPARALAEQETQLFAQPDHPWWKLLDRMITVGSVHDDGEADGPVTAALGLVVERMRQAPQLDRDTCQAAADEVQQVASRRMGERNSELGAQIDEMRHQVDREDLEATLRGQLVQQLRSTPVSLGLRQFLVGPWTQVMTETTLREGAASRALDEHAFVVDDLIRATAAPGKPVSLAQQRVLLRQVGLALASAGLPETRVEAEVADLKTLLRNPPPPHDEPWGAPAADDSLPMPLPPHPADDVTTAAMIDLQGGLPTVPIGMGADSTLEAATHQRDWLDALEPGACCRLFLLGRWMNAQLSWVSDSHNLFLFTSRHGGRTHSLTRRMLGKLRNAGLATTIEDGALLAQAMQQLVETDFASH